MSADLPEELDGVAVLVGDQGKQRPGYAMSRVGDVITVELEDGQVVAVDASQVVPVPGP